MDQSHRKQNSDRKVARTTFGRSGPVRSEYHLGGRVAKQAGHRNGRGTVRNIHEMKREWPGRRREACESTVHRR